MASCQNCGKCCDMNTFNVHVYPYDVARWKAARQDRIIDELTFGIDSQKRQIWTFKKQKDGHCAFRLNGHCAIWHSRPLTCRVYPATHEDKCLAGLNLPHPSVHAAREFNKASKAFMKWDTDRVQQELIKIIEGHGVKLEFDQSVVRMNA
jgi:Fe-S-cluster containining protein